MIEGWRKEAIKANREIGRVVLAYEAGRDGSLGAPRDSSDISWLRAPLIKAPRSPSDLLDHKLLAFSRWRVLALEGQTAQDGKPSFTLQAVSRTVA